jgi:hypothetical protein
MGKPSTKSQKSPHIRRKRRKIRMLKNLKSQEEEIGDLQIQLLDLKRLVSNEGGRVLSEINKCARENDNLVKWMNIYDEQIKYYQTEIYNLNLKLYFSSSPSSSSPPPPSSSSSPQQQQQQPQQQQPQQQQPQTFQTLADYFNYSKN